MENTQKRIEFLEKRIASNRQDIDRCLSSNLDLETIYTIIKMRTKDNENKINEIKKLKNEL
jgi:hypothetical protein